MRDLGRNEKREFLVHEFITLSVLGALGRNRTYAAGRAYTFACLMPGRRSGLVGYQQ